MVIRTRCRSIIVPEAVDQDCQLAPVDLADRPRAGRGVGIHCRAGIGRSSLMGAGVLRGLGVSEDPAWALITATRGLAMSRRTPMRVSAGPCSWICTSGERY